MLHLYAKKTSHHKNKRNRNQTHEKDTPPPPASVCHAFTPLLLQVPPQNSLLPQCLSSLVLSSGDCYHLMTENLYSFKIEKNPNKNGGSTKKVCWTSPGQTSWFHHFSSCLIPMPLVSISVAYLNHKIFGAETWSTYFFVKCQAHCLYSAKN